MRVAVATLFLALTASTTAFSDDVAAIGAGTATCGQYMNVYKRNPEETEKHFIGWMDGFFSGLNLAALMMGERSRNIGDKESNKQLLHAYCDKHPLQDVGQAAMAIYRSLPINSSIPPN